MELCSDNEVDHIDQNTTNNNLENLQVLSRSDHLSKTLKDSGFSSRRKTCRKCGNTFQTKTEHATCFNCRGRTKKDLSAQDIIEAYKLYKSWVGAANALGYSDKGLRKAYARLSGKDPKNIKADIV